MTTLNDFNKVDDDDDVMAAHVNDLISSSLLSEYQNVETLSGTRTLLDVDTPLQLFDCNGANRIVKMPTADTEDNHPFVINNVTASGSYTLTIQNNGGTVTYALLAVGDAVMMIPDGEGGYLVSWLGSISWGEFTEQASAPATPSTGKWKLYFKSDGLYHKDDAGTETGPFGTGTSTGWNILPATLTYSSADDPIFVVSSNADLTNIVQVGDKVKFTNNSTTFQGIIHAMGTWSGSAQLLTIFGGTDYDVANSAITAPYYSKAASPQGFPTSPAKWTYTAVNDANDHYKTSPTATTLYGGLNDYTTGADITFDAPIGLWKPRLACSLSMQNASARSGVKVAISTGNNSISDPALTASCSGYDNLTVPVYKEFSPLAVASKTTYYILITTPDTGVDTIALWGSTFSPTVITLVSAYL